MVKLNGLHPPTLDTKSNCDLPMTGEETGLGTSTPPLAGYLGKVQERCASLENCPWCEAKGLTFVLRSFRINLQESITLCTNSQCLFPLVSQSLDDVLASLVPPETQTRTQPQPQNQPISQIQLVGKRKNLSESESEEEKPVSHSAKRQCSEGDDLPVLQNGDAPSLKKPLPANETTLGLDGLCPVAKDNMVNGYHKDSDWPVNSNDTYQEELGDMGLEEVVAIQEKALPGPVSDISADPVPASMEAVSPSLASSVSSILSARSSPVTLQWNEEEEDESVMAEQEEAAAWSARAERGEETALSTPPTDATPLCDAHTFTDEEEEELRAVGESGIGECVPVAVVRPCSVDLSQSRVPEVLPEEEEEEERRKSTPAVERPDSLSGKTSSNQISLQSEVEVVSSEADDPLPKTRKRTRWNWRDAVSRSGNEAEPGQEEDSEVQTPLRKYQTSGGRDGKRTSGRKKALTNQEESGKKREEDAVPVRSVTEKISTGIDTSCQEEEEEQQQQQGPAKRARSVAAPALLFWKNRSNLCWLDVLLVALVNCRTLRGAGPPEDPEVSPVWSVLRRYDQALVLLQTHQKIGRWGVQRVSTAVWKQVNSLLETLRLDTFKLLQPKLQCKLGQKDSPVFAMPLLLKMDAWADPLFQLSFSWKQECTSCKHINNHRHVDVLPSFGPVASDWLPLNATQPVSCQACSDKEQLRMMSLESVPPVFALHFVEGLPDNDMAAYSFSFHDRLYSVTTVIQYGLLQKHFVTWVLRPDGTWLEMDGLKYPNCATHSKLEVPPKEIHIVFWETESLPRELPTTCSPTTSPVPRNKHTQNQSVKDLILDKPAILLEKSHLNPLPAPHDDVDIVTALTMETTATPGMDASIGSTTLLDTFEGLTHEDIVTLTLVEVKVDAGGKPVEGNLDDDGDAASPPPVPEELPAHTAMSDVHSLPATSDCPSPGLYPDLLTQSPAVLQLPSDKPNSSESDPVSEPESNSTNESSDPTFEPRSKRKRKSRAKVKMPKLPAKPKPTPTKRAVPPVKPSAPTVKPTGALMAAPPEFILPSVVGGGRAVSDPHPPAGRPGSSKPSDPQPRPPEQPLFPEQNSRVSFLLGASPLCSRASTSTPRTAPAPRPLNPAPPVPKLHLSTEAFAPSRVTRSPAPPSKGQPPPVPFHSPAQPFSRGGYPKPLLKTGDGKALPVKAAEMFGGFSSRTLPPQPQSHNAPLPQHHHQRPALVTRVSPTSPSQLPRKPLAFTSASPRLPGATQLLSPPPGSRSTATLPPGLSDTEALRYKLLKRLKAKKKKLEKLNMKLGDPGGAGLGREPGQISNSTHPISQYTVSSSTSAYNSPAYDEFFAELLSPSTTASNLSPDSTGYLEMLANGQEGGGDSAYAGNAIGGELVAQQQFKKHETATQQPVANGSVATASEHFLEEFIGEQAVQPQSEMESEALNALDLFF